MRRNYTFLLGLMILGLLGASPLSVLGGEPQFIRGDADANGILNGLTDGLFVLDYQFTGGATPPCLEAADADDDGTVNGLADAISSSTSQATTGCPISGPSFWVGALTP